LLTPWLTPYIMVYDWSILLVPAALLWQEVRSSKRPRLPAETEPATGPVVATEDHWTVLAACVWLAALLSGPLVMGQLHLLPLALHPALPVLVGVVVLGRGGIGAPGR